MRATVGTGVPRPEDLAVGRVFGPYKILSAIQRGGMGELFLAERTDKRAPQNKVVLKRLLADYLEDERYVRMFRSEAKVMSRLDHPNIVKVFDVPVIDGKQCLAMEYVQGRNLAQILRRCSELNTAMPPQVGLHIMTEILRGLDYAHGFVLDDGRPLGLVHRDVTPPNILVSFDGSVKITDFGIAKSEMSSVSTTVGVVKGTTRYLAPEQIRGLTATPRSDLFSAAVVLVEVLTGVALFDHGSVPPTLFAIVTGQRKAISDLLPFPAPKLSAALERALDLTPERRFRSAHELVEALEEAQREIGRPIEKSGVGIFLKELFRGSEQLQNFEDEVGPWHLDAMDLTYLFEVQELNAFHPEAKAAPLMDRKLELERVKAMLKSAVPGANPLDADQFKPKKEALLEGLSSPSVLRKLPREETKLDRPKGETPFGENLPRPELVIRTDMLNRAQRAKPVEAIQVVEPSEPPLADTADVFSDPTQMVDDVMVEDTAGEESVDNVRIDPASLPMARIPPTITPVRAPPAAAPVHAPAPAPAPRAKREPTPRPKRSRAGLTFILGLVVGAGAWSQVWRIESLLPPEVLPIRPPVQVAEARERPRRSAPHLVYPSLQHRTATASERALPHVELARPVSQMALLTVKKPRGARVRLNGMVLEDRTPLVDHPIEPGVYNIEVGKRKTKRFHLEVHAGEQVDLATLTPLQPKPTVLPPKPAPR